MADAVIGFRVKTGRAIVVLLSGPAARPVALDRREMQLSDPAEPASGHLYHPALELSPKEGAREVARLSGIAERFSSRSLAELFQGYSEQGHQIRRGGIVVGSDVDPASIKGAHIRAHAEEGRFWRVRVEQAASSAGLDTTLILEKELLAKASEALGRPPEQIKKMIGALGKSLGGPWRSEEKQAALAAWILLGRTS